MKKTVKLALIIVVLAMGLAFGLSVRKETQKDITLGFQNSGTPEWYELVEIRAPRKGFYQVNGFKNSGLPETIEIQLF